MTSRSHARPLSVPALPWLLAALIGVATPVAILLLLASRAGGAVPLGSLVAVGLMGVGMIGAAAAGRFRTGLLAALVIGAGLLALAWSLGAAAPATPFGAALAMLAASLSFAVRGALFARSAADKGWWIAVFVVAGEVAIVATALVMPGALPVWLLALLPAQWASTAIESALTGPGLLAASAPLAALVGTAAATHFVALLWPRRWPYLVMFSTWLACSALVFHFPAPPLPHLEWGAAAPALD